MLVSRTESKLKACEEEMRKKFNVKVKRCTADLTKCDDATFNRIEECLEGLDIGILVNNAGMSYDHPDYLDTIDNDRLRDIITINTLAPTRVGAVEPARSPFRCAKQETQLTWAASPCSLPSWCCRG